MGRGGFTPLAEHRQNLLVLLCKSHVTHSVPGLREQLRRYHYQILQWASPASLLQVKHCRSQESKCAWEKRAIAPMGPACRSWRYSGGKSTNSLLSERWMFPNSCCMRSSDVPHAGGAVTQTSHTPNSGRKARSQTAEFHNALITASASSPSRCTCSIPSLAHTLQGYCSFTN